MSERGGPAGRAVAKTDGQEDDLSRAAELEQALSRLRQDSQDSLPQIWTDEPAAANEQGVSDQKEDHQHDAIEESNPEGAVADEHEVAQDKQVPPPEHAPNESDGTGTQESLPSADEIAEQKRVLQKKIADMMKEKMAAKEAEQAPAEPVPAEEVAAEKAPVQKEVNDCREPSDEEKLAAQKRAIQQKIEEMKERAAQKVFADERAAGGLEEKAAQHRAAQLKVEEMKARMKLKAAEVLKEDLKEDEDTRLQKRKDVLDAEREARERMVERLRAAGEAEELQAAEDAQYAAWTIKERQMRMRKQQAEAHLVPQSSWVYVSPWGRRGRMYRPVKEQVSWRGIFDGPVQAAFVWDDLFYVAKQDGRLAVCTWGQPWEGEYEYWGPILEGEVQAAWVCRDTLYVVKNGLVASTHMGEPWNGNLEEWGDHGIFAGNVQAAFMRTGRLYVVKDGRIACENWMERDWDGELEDWGPMFPRSMKTAFVADEVLFVAREGER